MRPRNGEPSGVSNGPITVTVPQGQFAVASLVSSAALVVNGSLALGADSHLSNLQLGSSGVVQVQAGLLGVDAGDSAGAFQVADNASLDFLGGYVWGILTHHFLSSGW